MKKFVLIGLLSLCGSLLCGMDIHTHTKKLLKVALNTDEDAKKFTDFVAEHRLDLDSLYAKKPELLEQRLNGTGKKSTVALKNRINCIYAAIDRYRSSPPGTDTLRAYIKEAMDDNTYLAGLRDLKAFLKGRHLNIDRIVYEPATSEKTIGALLDGFRRDLTNQPQLLKARDILLIEEIKDNRTDPANQYGKLRNLIIDALVDENAFETLKKEYTGIDIDYVLMAPLTTEEAILRLTKDGLEKPKGKTIGEELDGRSAEPNARKILGLVRPHRKKELDTFTELLNAYLKDKTKLTDLKKWFEEYPFDIDSVSPWNIKQKQKTYGQEVNALHDPGLLELFKASRSNTVPKYAQEIADREARAYFWKKVLFATAIIGGGLFYYWSTTQNNDQQSTAAQPIMVT